MNDIVIYKPGLEAEQELEILTPADGVVIWIANNPFRADRQYLIAPAGLTVQEYVEYAVNTVGGRWEPSTYGVSWIDGTPCVQDIWDVVRLKKGTTILMRPVPKEVVSAIIGIITAAVSSITSALAGLGFLGKLIGMGIGLGIKLLMNKLFAPKPPKQIDQEQPKQSYSIAGSRNQANQWGPIPVILGKMRVAPSYAAIPYTENISDDQYLRMLFCVGYGPLDISDIRIGETPIALFDGVSVQTRVGLPSDLKTSLYARQTLEEPLSIVLKKVDGYHTRVTSTEVDWISIDLTLPDGLCVITKEGDRKHREIVIEWQYRKAGAPSWINGQDFRFRYNTLEAIRRTRQVDVPIGAYEIRVRKATAEVASNKDRQIFETVLWTAIRGTRTEEPIQTDEPVSVIAVRIKSSSQLNGTIDTLNCIAESRTLAYQGGSWVSGQNSRYPADLFRFVLTECQANKRREPVGRLDLPTIQAWKAYCVTNKFYYDKQITTVTSVWELLKEICFAGRAEPVWKDGKWSVVWDERNTPIVGLLTPRNSWDFVEQRQYKETPHALVCRFANSEKRFVEDERIVYDQGYSKTTAKIFEARTYPGVTTREANYKHGRFELAQTRLRPSVYSVMTDFEGLPFQKNDRIMVAHDSILVGLQSGRVKSAENVGTHSVTVDTILTLESNKEYAFIFRLNNNTYLTRTAVAGQSGELTTIQLSGSGSIPAEGNLFTFGIADRETITCRVVEVRGEPNFARRITMTDDAPEIWSADTGPIPEYDSNITEPPDIYQYVPTNLSVTFGTHLDIGLFSYFLSVSWYLPRQGSIQRIEVWYRNADDIETDDTGNASENWIKVGDVLPPQNKFQIRELPESKYQVRIRAVFRDGTFSNYVLSTVVALSGIYVAPDQVTNFRVATSGSLSTLTWNPVTIAGFSTMRYEIRFVQSTQLAITWNTATPLFQNLIGTSVQLQTQIGTYLIKAVSPAGVYSENPTLLTTNISQFDNLNLVETLQEAPGFTGTREFIDVVSGEMMLLNRATMDKWEFLDEVISLEVGDGGDDTLGREITGTYTFADTVDLGDVYTSKVTSFIDSYGLSEEDSLLKDWPVLANIETMSTLESSDWSVTIEYRTTLVDPILDDWSSWQGLTVSDITFRAIQLRAILTGRASDDPDNIYTIVTPVVTSLGIQIDMPDLFNSGEDIVCPVGGMTIVFDRPFKGPTEPAISTADQNMQTGDYKVINTKNPDGFFIRFFNSGGAGVERTFDYIAKGYGRKVV